MTQSQMLFTTVQLCELNEQNLPIGFASGCLIRLRGRKLLVSVEHATGNNGRWAMQIGYDKARGAANYVVGNMNFVMRLDISKGESKTIDFSYVEVPEAVRPTRHVVNLSGDTLSRDEIEVFEAPFANQLNVGDVFSFEGAVKPKTYQNAFNPDRPVYETEVMLYENFTFVRRENDFLVFKMPFKHPGHEWFRGCSGAPILNAQRQPVGLISNGRSDTDEILAVALDKLIPVVEATMSKAFPHS